MNENRITSWKDTEPESTIARELEKLHDRLDRLTEAVDRLDRRREELEDWVVDVLPAANGAIEVASAQLQALEASGAVPLAKELVSALGIAAARIDPEDLRVLAENADMATRSLRAAASPEVTTVIERGVATLGDGRTGPPPGLWTLLRRARKPHVRRGLTVALDLLQVLGEGAPPSMPERATPRRTPDRPRPASSAPAAAGATAARPAARPTATAPSTAPATGGGAGRFLVAGSQRVELDAEGFLVDRNEWTRDVAQAIAEEAGVGPLTEDHWRVIEFCREDAAGSGAAPGLRRITTELGMPPKDMYTLFPGGPGILAARIAGLGKPRSCV